MRAYADRLREELGPLVGALLDHPFVTALEAETLPRETLRRFAAQDLLLVEGAGRALTAAALAAPREDHPRYLHMAAREAEERQELMALGEALGAPEEELAGAEPLAGCAALFHFLYWLCAFAPAPQRGAAFAAIQAVFSRMARRITAALRSQYGLSAQAVALFARHGERALDDPLAWVGPLSEQGADEPMRRAILAGARQALALETMFFDAVVRGEPAPTAEHPPWRTGNTAEAFAERLVAEWEPLRMACLDHPFPRAVEEGTAPR